MEKQTTAQPTSGTPATVVPPTKLELLLRQSTADEKKELITGMGVTERTFFVWCNRPGIIPIQSMLAIEAYLEGKYGRIIPLKELLAPAA